jgi:hypothetical protein
MTRRLIRSANILIDGFCCRYRRLQDAKELRLRVKRRLGIMLSSARATQKNLPIKKGFQCRGASALFQFEIVAARFSRRALSCRAVTEYPEFAGSKMPVRSSSKLISLSSSRAERRESPMNLRVVSWSAILLFAKLGFIWMVLVICSRDLM